MASRYPPEVIGLALLVAADAAGFLSGMLPSLFTIQKFNAGDEARASIYRGMIIGNALTLVVGAGASMASSSGLPFAAAVATLVVLDAAYLHALNTPMAEGRDMRS
jgi:hypothetical protein